MEYTTEMFSNMRATRNTFILYHKPSQILLILKVLLCLALTKLTSPSMAATLELHIDCSQNGVTSTGYVNDIQMLRLKREHVSILEIPKSRLATTTDGTTAIIKIDVNGIQPPYQVLLDGHKFKLCLLKPLQVQSSFETNILRAEAKPIWSFDVSSKNFGIDPVTISVTRDCLRSEYTNKLVKVTDHVYESPKLSRKALVRLRFYNAKHVPNARSYAFHHQLRRRDLKNADNGKIVLESEDLLKQLDYQQMREDLGSTGANLSQAERSALQKLWEEIGFAVQLEITSGLD